MSESEVRALAAIADELNYYELLEVEVTAPTSKIRLAYHNAARRFHPDALGRRWPELRGVATTVAKRFAEAYSVLRDPRRRQIYDQKLAEGGHVRLPLVQAEAEADRKRRALHDGHTPQGRRYYALVRSDLSRGDASSALRNLRMAMTYEPENELFRKQFEELSRAS